MKFIVTAIDFSETSLSAARYAAQFVKQLPGHGLVLYHHFTREWEADQVKQQLESLRESFLRDYGVDAEVMIHFGEIFTEDLERYLVHRAATLLIMGITGRGAVAQVLVGSHTLQMVETGASPVLIIPEKAEYRPVRQVLLATDMKGSESAASLDRLMPVLKGTHAQLHIMNVDPSHYITVSEDYQRRTAMLSERFAEFNPQFHFMRLYDVDEAIRLLAEDLGIDMVVAIRRQRNFLESLFRGSRTRSLSYQTNIPMLVIQE